MDSELTLRNKNIKKTVFWAFLFMLVTMIGGTLFGSVLNFLPPQTMSIVFIAVGALVITLVAKPEGGLKGMLQTREKMTVVSFFVVLGAMMTARLIGTLVSLPVLTAFVNEDNAAAFADIGAENSPVINFLFMAIATPICEEIAFRGCVGRGMKPYGIWFAILMSSLVFAMYHGNLFQLISAFLPGCVLFYVAEKYSLKWSMVLHFINNGSVCLMPYVQKLLPAGFVANAFEYMLQIALILAAVILLKKDGALPKVKEFFRGPKNEKGAFKAAIGNVWFILMLVFIGLTTIMMIAMLSGAVQMDPSLIGM